MEINSNNRQQQSKNHIAHLIVESTYLLANRNNRRILIMTVKALIFPFGEVKKFAEGKGISFRACASIRKAGKQSKDVKENYVSQFYDCKTFSKDVYKTLQSAYIKESGKFKGLDIEGYVEISCFKRKDGTDGQSIVFNITSADVHSNKVDMSGFEPIGEGSEEIPF